MPVRFHVVGVDVGDDRQHGLQDQKRRIGLIGFRDRELALAQARVGVLGEDPAADHERGIAPAFAEHGLNEPEGALAGFAAGGVLHASAAPPLAAFK